ncbi:MAG: nucleotidyltransferase domain-containing protein [Nitrospirae bacterium]|nr:nucleotidyltransferase domain-containing protein [Nitrospirota bacterium]
MAVRKNIKELVKKYKSVVNSSGIKIRAIYLYGSYARNLETEDSDIDVAIISDDFSGNRWQDGLRVSRLRRKIDLNIEPVTFRSQDFIEEDPLVAEIKRHGIRI